MTLMVQSSAFEGRQKALKALKGQGIVFAAGGKNHVSNMFIAMRVLRDVLHSKLPIQVVFNGNEELDKKNRDFLEVRAKRRCPFQPFPQLCRALHLLCLETVQAFQLSPCLVPAWKQGQCTTCAET